MIATLDAAGERVQCEGDDEWDCCDSARSCKRRTILVINSWRTNDTLRLKFSYISIDSCTAQMCLSMNIFSFVLMKIQLLIPVQPHTCRHSPLCARRRLVWVFFFSTPFACHQHHRHHHTVVSNDKMSACACVCLRSLFSVFEIIQKKNCIKIIQACVFHFTQW